MKKTITTYVPFEHDNFEYKKTIIDLARQQGNDLQGVLTSTLIFINAVDYVASHLLENLRIITHLLTHQSLNATVFVEYPEQQKGLPLGEMTKLLRQFEFPDKSELIEELNQFNALRVKYVHRLLSTPPDEIYNKIDVELSDLKRLAESILGRYDLIVKGISDAWFSYISRLAATSEPSIPVAKLKEESPVTNPETERENSKTR